MLRQDAAGLQLAGICFSVIYFLCPWNNEGKDTLDLAEETEEEKN